MRKVDINGRIFEIDGDRSSDYYTVFGTTQKEVQEHQHKLESFVPSKLSSGRFKKLSDAKKFIRIVVDASKTKRYYKVMMLYFQLVVISILYMKMDLIL